MSTPPDIQPPQQQGPTIDSQELVEELKTIIGDQIVEIALLKLTIRKIAREGSTRA